MTELTPAERGRLAIEVMGCVKGWLLVPSAANYLWFETEQEAVQYRYEHNWIADVVEAYVDDGHYVLLSDWLPDLPGHIEQAFELLDAMHLKDWWESITAIIDDNTYMVKLLHYPTQRLVGWRETTREYAICRAVLAALEVK